jgi:F-type H+-transporting ATPase subunit b
MENTGDTAVAETGGGAVGDSSAQGAQVLTAQQEAPQVEHEAWLFDSYGWVAVAFVVFMLLIWRVGGFRSLGAALDSRGAKVRADLAEAAQLKAEAEALRSKAVEDAAQAARDADAIVANAHREAEALVANAEMAAHAAVARRQRLAEDRITAAQRSAEAALRARAADLATRAARDILAERAARGELAGMTDRAILEIGAR